MAKSKKPAAPLTAEERAELVRIADELEFRQNLIKPRATNLPQVAATKTWADIMFYGGAAGGGKSFLLMILAITQHTKTVIFRRTYAQTMKIRADLRGIVNKIPGSRIVNDSKEFYFKFGGIDRTIHVKTIPNAGDVERVIQGNEYDLMAFDEATHFALDWIFYLSTWNRSASKTQRCRLVLTSNPPTSASGKWLSTMWAKWINPRYSGIRGVSGQTAWFIKANDEMKEVSSPDPVEIDGETLYPVSMAFIQAKPSDNDLLDSEYYKRMSFLPETMRRAFRDGDWGVMDLDSMLQIFPSEWVELARERGREMKANGTWGTAAIESVGCDVAISEDRSAQAYFDGRAIREVVRVVGSHTPTGEAFCNWVIAEVQSRCLGYLPSRINVDGSNLAAGEIMERNSVIGRAVIKWLFQWKPTIERDRSGFYELGNIKAQAFEYLAWLLNPSNPNAIALPPDDEELASELKSIKWADSDRSDLRFVELKDDYIKRTGKSPDLVDACVFAVIHRLVG